MKKSMFILIVVMAVSSIANGFSDDFEDGLIDTSLWVYGADKRGWQTDIPPGVGNWNYSHEEIVDATDGYLSMHVWGPTSGNTYGAEAWVRTSKDFNDGKDYLINFTWEAVVGEPAHYDRYYIQITDGYIPYYGDIHWPSINRQNPVGTVNFLVDTDNGWSLTSGSISKTTWSMTITSDGIGKLYNGPNGSGSLIHQDSLDDSKYWYLRLMLIDATSSGFPGGDNRLNLYDFSAVSELTETMLSGVVFEDKNENGSYNPGEEISGAQVSAQGISDTTGSDGRYLLQELTPGVVVLTAKIGGDLYVERYPNVQEGANNFDILVPKTWIEEAYACADVLTVCIRSLSGLVPLIGVPSQVEGVKDGICQVKTRMQGPDPDVHGAGIAAVLTAANALSAAYSSLSLAIGGVPELFSIKIETLLATSTCIESQLYEWLPYDGWDAIMGQYPSVLPGLLPILGVATKSPVNIRIIDSQGNVMERDAQGLTKNELSSPGWIFRGPDDKELALIFDAEDQYVVAIVGRPEAGTSSTFDLKLMCQKTDGSQTILTYTNVPISAQGTATTVVSEGIKPVLEVDVDGDGTVDLNTLSDSLAMEVVPLLPSSDKNKAGRTMPVKFSLRRPERVDPATPFVYDEDLEIRIHNSTDPSTILQTSRLGDTARDYRIDTADELYITNFRTKKEPAEYVVEIWRTDLAFQVGSFNFETVK